MSRDYKPGPERSKKTSKGSPFLSGLLVGFLLGVGASLAVVMYIKGVDSPFAENTNNKKPLSQRIMENSKQIDANKGVEADTIVPDNRVDDADDKTRFDFYTILPGSESKVNTIDRQQDKTQSASAVQYDYYLQVGAFQTGEEADNMKAKLALQGFEAVVQTADIPNKGIWHRVRVGPLNDLDQISKTQSDLLANGFKTDLIKINAEN
ncbi:MAG: sporulation protein [Betaproteobacteria bacterium HGW-Betaproteobacteria-22]|nr:MAG: sporulation protein [Betaproteobacteria bacterium HGW-Betaproteobacteria-22]